MNETKPTPPPGPKKIALAGRRTAVAPAGELVREEAGLYGLPLVITPAVAITAESSSMIPKPLRFGIRSPESRSSWSSRAFAGLRFSDGSRICVIVVTWA